jgi:hypothetical protein
VEPNKRRLPAERADKEGNMILPVVRSTKCEDLRVWHVVERQARAGQQRNIRLEVVAS